MAYYVAALLRAQRLLHRGVVVHADLGRVEWKGTCALAAAQAAHFGLGFVVVKRTQGDLLVQVEKLRKWPMPTQRYCTADHKRQQILRAFTAMVRALRAKGIKRPVRILNCIGLRAEESPARRKRPTLLRDKRASNGLREVDVWLPIQHWTEAEVWRAVRASGAPVHPAYAAGFPRASCIFCIFMPDEALYRAGRQHPELLADYVGVEQKIGHTFKRHLPLAKVAADIAAGITIGDGPIKSWRM